VSVTENKVAARRFVQEVLDGSNDVVARELFVPGAVRHFPPGDIIQDPTRPPARTARTSMRTDVHHLYGEGDFVTIHLTHHVSFAPDARFNTRMGWADVGGHNVEWNAMVILRFEGERIAEEWVVRDELQVLLQVGAVKPLQT
jgi:SnoaL-like polyketide cyclase